MADSINENKIRVKKYLGLENVSVLAGAGTSWHLGAPVIRNIPEELKLLCQKDIDFYFGTAANPSYEDLFNCLQADRFIKEKKGESTVDIDISIKNMQKWLFDNCNTEKTVLEVKNDERLNRNRYHYHEAFIKKLLQRPNNLKRVNLFTTNYDMAFDYALDNLGVHYLNGFMGVHNRCFRPEVYDYDLYYPGQSVTGKVHRAEKVLKYYKIHGSLSWLATCPTVNNTYGIKEIPLNDEFKVENDEKLMIYPCTSKKSFTLDLPYSELFRQFSQAINQPQSVLFCVGYSFYDEHINDIIKQALSIPSFTLIIVNYSKTKDANSPIGEFEALHDKRIIILDETDGGQSAFIGFVENVMPDFYEEEENNVIAETIERLYNGKCSYENSDSSNKEIAKESSKQEISREPQEDEKQIEKKDDLPF
ncbi:SIR2 family protein [Bacteroides ihuae]|uniref:SIR2 family protein n=1 Tax=Bacteroides ihuae TaxID=1852362 RepID=UPI0008DA3039|nr:SIR2 family protein [Bacteroides ihuae]